MHHLIRRISEYLVGLLFGFGLILGGMINPSKVIGFLDLLGLWDPSLAFVMGGAVILSYGAFRMTKRSGFSLQGRVIMLDDSKPMDARLLMGSGLFGIGWGLSGFCPGPALASLGTGEWKAALFVMATILGTWIAGRVKFGMN